MSSIQKILEHPGLVQNEPIGALARLELGRAYLLAGDRTKAKAAYQDFLTLWKNADPGTPNLAANETGICESKLTRGNSAGI